MAVSGRENFNFIARPAVFWTALAALLLPWFAIEFQLRVAADAVGLTQAALRFLGGQRMSDAYFDNNPPMCFLIYLPAALAGRLGMPLWWSIPGYAAILIAAAAVLMMRLLATLPDLPAVGRRLILAGFLASVTFPAWLEFGQKDHLIAIMLPPFLLAQWSLVKGDTKGGRARLAAFILGTPFILIKPHYGLLPVLMLLHRFLRRRDWRIVLDADFLCLAVGVLLYGAASALFVPDYFTVILPYAATLYLTQTSARVWPAALGLALLSGCLILAAFCAPKERRQPALFLACMALASVVPFAAQMKGFSVHMLPSLPLLLCAALAAGDGRVFRLMRMGQGLAGTSALILLGYAAFTPHLDGRTADAYRNGPLAMLLRRQVGHSSFFMQNETTNVVMQTALYAGIPQGSRFPVPWFLPKVAFAPAPTKTFFAEAVGQDLDRFRPKLVLLFSHPAPDEDMPRLFGNDPEFRKAFASYRRAGEFRLDYRDYPADRPTNGSPPVDYDVYVRLP